MGKGWKIYRRIIEESVIVLGVGIGLVWDGSSNWKTKAGISLVGFGVLLLDHRDRLRTIEDIYAQTKVKPIKQEDK